MSGIEKVWMLSCYEWRLLARAVEKLPQFVLIPIAGGLIFGLNAEAWGSDAGLIVVLAVSALIPVTGFLTKNVREALPESAVLSCISSGLSMLPVFIIQGGIYAAVISLRGGNIPPAGIFAAAFGCAVVITMLRTGLRRA